MVRSGQAVGPHEHPQQGPVLRFLVKAILLSNSVDAGHERKAQFREPDFEAMRTSSSVACASTKRRIRRCEAPTSPGQDEVAVAQQFRSVFARSQRQEGLWNAGSRVENRQIAS